MADYRDANTGEPVEDWELSDRYDDFIDECYPTVEIMGMTYPASRTLKEVDPIAYRVGFNDWIDSELGETLEEWENN